MENQQDYKVENEQVKAMIATIAEIVKVADSYKYLALQSDSSYNNHNYYNRNFRTANAINERNEMAVHISGKLPLSLIQTRRPREEEEIKNYRFANYEPTTQPLIYQAIDSLDRIFNPQNYTIKTSEILTEYINEAEFDGYTFMNWFQFRFKVGMLEDANSVVLCLPSGEGLGNKNERIEPLLCQIPCENILHCIENNSGEYESLFVCIKHYGNYKSMSDERQIDYVDFVYLDEYIYVRLRWDTKNGAYEPLPIYYEHNLGYVPAKIAKGRWNTLLDCYQSFFASFVPEANQSIREESDHLGTMITCGHPYRIVEPTNCTNTKCEGGYIGGFRDAEHLCGICKGTGVTINASPFGVYTRPQKNFLEDGESAKKDVNPIEFVSPDTAILQFQADSIEKRRQRAKESLHLNIIDEAQSGTAKAIDREREYAMILMISNNIFEHIEFALFTMERLIEINNPEDPIVIAPTKFNIKTEDHLIEELKQLSDAGAPVDVLRDKTQELLRKMYPGDDLILEKSLFLMKYDTLYSFPIDTRQSLLATGAITVRTFQKSINAPTLLDRYLINPNATLNSSQYDAVASALDKEVEKIITDLEDSKVAATPNFETIVKNVNVTPE